MRPDNIELRERSLTTQDGQQSASVSGPSNHLSSEGRGDANDEPEPIESDDGEVAASFVKFISESMPHDIEFNHFNGVFCWYKEDTKSQARVTAYTWAKTKLPRPFKPMITLPVDSVPRRFRDIYRSTDSEFTKVPHQGQVCIINSRAEFESPSKDLIKFIKGFIHDIPLGKTDYSKRAWVFERLINVFSNPAIGGYYNSMRYEDDDVYTLTYSTRYFVPYGGKRTQSQYNSPHTNELSRQTARLIGDNFFREKVLSSVLLCSKTPGRPYTIITLADYSAEFATEEQWKAYGLIPCGTENGVTQFLAMILLLMEECERGWMSAMAYIDSIVRVELETFYQEEKWEHLMFDESFRLSKDYFSVLQLLRILTDWIDSTENELESLRREWLSMKQRISRPKTDLDTTAEKNWDIALAIMKRQTETVRTRAARKMEEIKSLRDGLFNATSLREATRSMAINRAIYVFTIITVIYTPVGFLATFWALPFLNNPSGNGTVPVPAAFRNTFIIIPLLTYGFAIAIAVYFGYATVHRVIRRPITRIRHWIRWLFLRILHPRTARSRETMQRILGDTD
ncbi:hypothetical protein F4680DRAFT_17452 [Xylaria scruposa]|nr:hypothetical protein F4680DRAFT_17452 [Xylaria scruposa]